MRWGEPIETVYLRKRLETGIIYDDDRVHIGFIPEFEEREACLKAGYRWEEWLDMDIDKRCQHVAFHRVRLLVSAHSEDAADVERNRMMHQQQMRAKPNGA